MKKGYKESFVDSLSEFVYNNIDDNYRNKKRNTVFSKYGLYYGKRPLSIDNCLVIGCQNTPIYSHSISKNSVLSNISYKGKVYSPSINNDRMRIEMMPVGIEKQASVFPGFCNDHDSSLFKILDNTTFQDNSTVFFESLIYRTISREFYMLKRNLEYTEFVIENIEKDFETSKTDILNKYNSILSETKIQINDWEDSRFSYLRDKRFANNKLNQDQTRLNNLYKFIENCNSPIGLVTVVERNLPVAFSGFTHFIENKYQYSMVINCLPYKDKTIFSIFYNIEDQDIIERKLISKYDLNDENSLLKFIETLVIKGTDNLFIDIIYWDSLEIFMKEKIMKDYANFEDSDPRNEIDYSFLKWDYK